MSLLASLFEEVEQALRVVSRLPNDLRVRDLEVFTANLASCIPCTMIILRTPADQFW
jgi:hypothetical protein